MVFPMLDLSLLNKSPVKPQVIDQDKVYKDLNKRFYEKGTEHEFESYKQAIEKIAEKSSKLPASFHLGMFDSSPELVKLGERKNVISLSERKYFKAGVTKNISTIIRVTLSIFRNTKHNTLYKMYTSRNDSPLTIGKLKSAFYNEIYYQQKAHEIASSDHHFIVPRIYNYFSFVDESKEELNLVIEMDFVDMILVSDVLTPDNAEKYFKSIVNAVDKLNSAGVYQNDLTPNNIQISRENKEKIVIIDFGQASNETTVSGTAPQHLFSYSLPTDTMDYKSFVDWATEEGKYPLALNQKQESPISPNQSHKSSKRKSPTTSTPNKSHKSSRRESPNSSHKSPNSSHKSPSSTHKRISHTSPNSTHKRISHTSPNSTHKRISHISSRKRSLTGGKKQSNKKRRSSCGRRQVDARK
jgi:hypothetical protein